MNKKLVIHLTDETYMIFFCFLYFSISNISRMLAQFGIPRQASYFLFIICFFAYFLKNIYKLNKYDYLIWLLLTIGPVIGLIQYHEYIDSTNLYAIVILYIPAYFFFRTCDITIMTKSILYSAYFAAIYLLFYYYFFVRGNTGYDLSFGYWAAFPCCVLLYYLPKGKKINLLLAIPLLLSLFMSGSRGALGLTVACLLYYWMIPERYKWKDIIKTGSLLMILYLLYKNFETILYFFLNRFGENRNLTKLLNQGFFYSKPREHLFELCRRAIDDNPWGYGPLASRKIIVEYPYPHSIIYELQLDYGKYLGLALVAIIVISVVLLLLKSKKIKDLSCICGFISIIGIGSLFVSSSLYYECSVQAIFGLLLNIKYLYPTETSGHLKGM